MTVSDTVPTVARNIPRLIVGLAVLALGLLWTLDNLDVLNSEPITQWWPAVLILIGAVRLLDPAKGKGGSVFLIVIGIAILFDTLDWWDFDPGDLIPLFIAIIGIKLVRDAVRRKQPRVTGMESADAIVHAFAFMAGVQRRSTATDFRGGDANAIMGGVELDLRDARIQPGQEVIIDTFAMWGGIDIRVPADWRVVSEVMPLMASYEDKTTGKDAGGPVLVVRGVAIMGGIEVKN